MGLLNLIDVGRAKAVHAVGVLEKNSAGKLSLGTFRGAENLIDPDAMLLVTINGF